MRILIPVDGSRQSEKALEYAVKTFSSVAGDFKVDHMDNSFNRVTELIILHVLPQFAVPLGFERPMKSSKTNDVISFSDYIQELNDIFVHEWENKLSEYTQKYGSIYTLIKTRLVKQSESVADTIIGVADKEQIDMIVVGNVGLGGVSKIKTLGSISRSVSEKAKCPVLIVH